jgi:hypothetical protein
MTDEMQFGQGKKIRISNLAEICMALDLRKSSAFVPGESARFDAARY